MIILILYIVGSFTFGKKEKVEYPANRENIPEFHLSPLKGGDKTTNENNLNDQSHSIDSSVLPEEHITRQVLPKRRSKSHLPEELTSNW